MITMTQMYWLTSLDSIIYIFTIMCWASLIIFIVLMFIGAFQYTEVDEKIGKKIFWLSLIPAILSLLFMLAAEMIPSTNQMAFIYLAPKMANNKDFQQIPGNASKLLNDEMVKYINQIGDE